MYSSRSFQICPLINPDYSGSRCSELDCERRSPVSALLRGAQVPPGAPAPPLRTEDAGGQDGRPTPRCALGRLGTRVSPHIAVLTAVSTPRLPRCVR